MVIAWILHYLVCLRWVPLGNFYFNRRFVFKSIYTGSEFHFSFFFLLYCTVHCKEDPIYVFPEIKRCAASFTISIFIHLWAIYKRIYSQDRSTCFAAAKVVDQSWDNINRSQIYDCRNWEWGRAFSLLGIFLFQFSVKCLCSVCIYVFLWKIRQEPSAMALKHEILNRMTAVASNTTYGLCHEKGLGFFNPVVYLEVSLNPLLSKMLLKIFKCRSYLRTCDSGGNCTS